MPEPIELCTDRLRALLRCPELRDNIAADLEAAPSTAEGMSDARAAKWLEATTQLRLASNRLADNECRVVTPVLALADPAEAAIGVQRLRSALGPEKPGPPVELCALDMYSLIVASPAENWRVQKAYVDLVDKWSAALPVAYSTLRETRRHDEILALIGMPSPRDTHVFFSDLEARYGRDAPGALHNFGPVISNFIVRPTAHSHQSVPFQPSNSTTFYLIAGNEFTGTRSRKTGASLALSLPIELNGGVNPGDSDELEAHQRAYEELDRALRSSATSTSPGRAIPTNEVLARRVLLRLYCLGSDVDPSRPFTPAFDRLRHQCALPDHPLPTELAFGVRVEVHGLQSAAGSKMNGWRGVITSTTPTATGRWTVSLDEVYEDTSLTKRNREKQSDIKPTNLKIVGMSYLGFIPGARPFKSISTVLWYSQADVVALVGATTTRLANLNYPGHAMYWSATVAPGSSELVIAPHDPNETSLQDLEATLQTGPAVMYHPGGWCATWATFEAECFVTGADTLHRELKEDAQQVLSSGTVAAGRPLRQIMDAFGVDDPTDALTALVCRLWLRRLDMYTRCWQDHPAREAARYNQLILRTERDLASMQNSDDGQADPESKAALDTRRRHTQHLLQVYAKSAAKKAVTLPKTAAMLVAVQDFIRTADGAGLREVLGLDPAAGAGQATAARFVDLAAR